MKELYLNNQLCDLNESDPIQYNFQVNDIGDVESRQTTFTNTISLPKTKNNTMILEGLGLAGDASTLPYQKINASLFEDTIPVIYNGWAVISNTDESYNLNLYSGIVDLFKAIENKTIGTDLDISETEHNKDLYSVYNSFTNEYYRYIIADYNGKSHLSIRGESYVNIEYLVPSIRCKYLIDKIQETFGFEFIGSVFSNPKYLNWWMTYPKPSPEVSEEVSIDPVLVSTGSVLNLVNPYYEDGISEININNGFNAIEGWWLNDREYKVEKAGTFNMKYKGDGNARYYWEDYTNQTDPRMVDNRTPDLNLCINGNVTDKLIYMRNIDSELNFSVNVGDVISFVYVEIYENKPQWRLDNLKIDYFDFSISQISLGEISFKDALIDFGIKDFFKEFLWQFSLTPIPQENNKVLFLTTDERINAEIVNWTDKYNGRINEEYVYGNYAQRNNFKYKYNEENSTYNDGFIQVNNQNLEDEIDSIQSKIYTTEKDKVKFPVSSTHRFDSNVYRIWQKEVQEKEDDKGNSVTEIKYKDLSNRYYFIRSKENTNSINLAYESINDSIKVSGFSQEDYSDLSFSEIIKNEYLSLDSLINNSRKHFIKLKNLTPVDIQNLRFDAVYYFEQEQQHYILNKLPYQNAKENIGEFIRVIRK
ncbi:Uncharacterised protein [Algoriella xinjiangensis]|uniref:hypothetical protein n=1 Tax=Algoriella xinjiangensis TaxID=684065 RepID=UPI000F62C610|nr:hypothetical protein [Algoriella xinjiangensis]VDH16714.1 Uncharacterised protein [Algoriella xinjiangensis]